MRRIKDVTASKMSRSGSGVVVRVHILSFLDSCEDVILPCR